MVIYRGSLLLLLASCGRVGFDPAPSADGPTTDDATVVVVDGARPTPVVCPTNYVPLSTGCYRLVTSGARPSAAEAICRADGAHLVSIGSAEENAEIHAFTANAVWIGVVDPGTGFVDIVSGAPLTYTNWAPGDPNGEGACSRMLPNLGDWDDEPCNNNQSYVCEHDGALAIVTVP